MVMTTPEKNLVVVSVFEGRGFPKRSRCQLIAEARFDGELLSTDPIPHVETPDFTQELAWELGKRALQQHRLQRSSIKVQVYAVDSQSGMKEAVGYVVLDLRSAKNVPTAKWLPLLHCKYHKTKAEVRIGIYLDEQTGEDQPSFKAAKAPARPINGTGRLDALKPVLCEAGQLSYYQIGPADQCTDHFMLSVTIASALNLAQLVPSSTALDTGGGFFFYFCLLGNDVINEKFTNLLNPDFPAERASVRLRSSLKLLRAFLAAQPGIQVHLCCGEQSLGSAEVPLSSLIAPDSTEIYMRPLTCDAMYKLMPPNRLKQQLPKTPDEAKVGVIVTLKHEEGEAKVVQASPSASPQQQKTAAKRSDRSPSPHRQQQAKKREERVEYSEDFEDDSASRQATPRDDPPAKLVRTEEGKEEAGKKSLTSRVREAAQAPGDQAAVNLASDAHHFCFSADLRCLRALQRPHPANVFLRYTYPFFGSAKAIMTHPPVEVVRGQEVVLPESFCAFDFATSTHQLKETFSSVPLRVEVYDREKETARDVLLGVAVLPLDQLASSPATRATRSNGGPGWRQTLACRLSIATPDTGAKVAELDVSLGLEDWGEITPQALSTHAPHPQEGATVGASTAPLTLEGAKGDTRSTLEYQAALELEMWKEAQEADFTAQLKQKETTHMKKLAEEWRRKDTERELLVKKKVSEYNELERQLKKTLGDLHKRENVLAANEQELKRVREECEREHARKLEDVSEASRRLTEDCAHKVQLERNQAEALDQMIARLKEQIKEGEAKYAKLEADFARYKEDQSTRPEVRLQAEINMLTLEKAELERKMDAMGRSKTHYKQQWGRALRELAKARQQEQLSARTSLKRQQQELQHLRLRYLAAEEQSALTSERSEIAEMKREMERLKTGQLNQSAPPEYWRPLVPEDLQEGEQDEHITRLVEERDTLLRTGVYTTQDRIIAELDRQIRDAIARQGSKPPTLPRGDTPTSLHLLQSTGSTGITAAGLGYGALNAA